MTTLKVSAGTRNEKGIMTALRHIDHGVTCDGLTHGTGEPVPCGATVWQSEVLDSLMTHAIAGFRNWLRRQGWQLGAVLPDDPKADPLDFCPQHRKDAK